MINLFEKFCTLNRNIINNQFLLETEGVIKAYYGINQNGKLRLSFLSSKASGIKDITKNIDVIQGNASENNFWTCFDLNNEDLLQVFCSFGEDLISSIYYEKNENIALSKLKVRYQTWLALFKKSRISLSPEKVKGLFGELYYLKNYMFNYYDTDKALKAWVGPDNFNKDFSVDKTWYEIKTISAGSAVVKISSLQQLSSDLIGKLVIIRAEEMSDAFKGKDSSINELIHDILNRVENDFVKDSFLDKLSAFGFEFDDVIGNKKFSVTRVDHYLVDENFPVLREKNIVSDAINNVSYELIIKLLDNYLEK